MPISAGRGIIHVRIMTKHYSLSDVFIPSSIYLPSKAFTEHLLCYEMAGHND